MEPHKFADSANPRQKDCVKCGLAEENKIHIKTPIKKDSSTSYKGPLVFIHREDIEPLMNLLETNPREWNTRLRADCQTALEYHKMKEAKNAEK